MSYASRVDEAGALEERLLEFLDRYCRDRSLTLREAAEWFDDSFEQDEPPACA
jgi:hypothetical protein